MLQQLAAQLRGIDEKPVVYDHSVPFMVLMSFLFTGWLVYSGVVHEIAWYLDLRPAAHATTLEFIDENPSVTINGFTFDHELNPDWNYVPGYGYPK